MGRCRFVQPKVVRLPISDGDWIEIKEQLTLGDEREAMAAVAGHIDKDGNRYPNYKMLGVAEVLAYLVNWSLVSSDLPNAPVEPVSVGALLGMPSVAFNEIEAVIREHVASLEKIEADRKNVQSTPTESVAT